MTAGEWYYGDADGCLTFRTDGTLTVTITRNTILGHEPNIVRGEN